MEIPSDPNKGRRGLDGIPSRRGSLVDFTFASRDTSISGFPNRSTVWRRLIIGWSYRLKILAAAETRKNVHAIIDEKFRGILMIASAAVTVLVMPSSDRSTHLFLGGGEVVLRFF